MKKEKADMKRYRDYMDRIKASDTLHQRLVELEAPSKRPIPWKKYGAVAAALALVCGLGAWGLGQGGWDALAGHFRPETVPEIADDQPDIAAVDPNDVAEPGEKTLGGYEVTSGSGPAAIVAHYVLPYIEYGGTDGVEMCFDWDVPPGAVKKELTQDEIAALLGGEDAVNTHLDWGGYELTGWAAWYEDGSFWGAYINGEKIPAGLLLSASYPCPDDRFEFAVTAGQLPPTCIAYPGSVTQEIRGLIVTADKYDGEHGCSRRVSFMKDDHGYRFDLTSTDAKAAELLISRLVCRIADKGLALDALKGAEMCALPPVPTSSVSVDEPNYEDGVPAQEGDTSAYDPASSTGETYTCPDCGETFPVDELRAHIHSFYACEICGESVSKGSIHFHMISNGNGTYTCNSCGVTVEEGVKHYHETDNGMCTGYPVPDPAESWEVCGLPLVPPDTSTQTTAD